MFTTVLSSTAQTALAILEKFRRTKGEFIQLFLFIKNGLSLDVMCFLYEHEYPHFTSNTFNLIKSLTYFEDAEETVMPQMLTPISWDDVKSFFLSESVRLGKKYLT